MVNFSSQPKFFRKSALQASLVALAVTTAAMLGGCGDSPTATADKNAAEASNKAARITRSAGEPRPNEKFSEAGNDITVENAKGKRTELVNKASADNFKNYFAVNPVTTELKTAADLLAKGTAPDVSSANKFVLQLQAGNIAIAQANVKLEAAEATLRAMATEAGAIQVLADQLNSIGGEAAVFDARKAADDSAQLTEARTALDGAKTAASDAATRVQGLQQQIAQKKVQAGEIYQKTDAAITAADAIKGKAAIEAYEKAVAERKAADKLSEEVANLSIELRKAEGDAAVAKIREAEAQAAVDALTASVNAGAALTSKSKEGAGEVRAAAKQLVTQPDTGLAARVKTFEALAAKLETDIADASKDSARAVTAFGDARRQWSAVKDQIGKLQLDAASNDPLLAYANDRRKPALVQLSQSIAHYTAARASTAGWLSASMQATVNEAAARGMKAAGMTAETPAANATEKANTYASQATGSLGSCISDATAAASVNEMPLPWLANAVLANANWAHFIISGDASYKASAEAAATKARENNYDLKFGSIIK